MNRIAVNYAPRARQEELVIDELGDETLVYDMRNHKAHCLNRTAALVWNRCDGRLTVSEMILALETELHTPVSAEVVWLALEQLNKANLLADRLPKSKVQPAMTRRAVMKRIGFGAAIAVPLVTSILAPSVGADVTSCIAGGGACPSGGLTCCPGLNCQSGLCI